VLAAVVFLELNGFIVEEPMSGFYEAMIAIAERRQTKDGLAELSCGIDVDVTDLDGALMLLRETLPSLGAPRGTELHYARSGMRLRDVFEGGSWTTGLPRTSLHPGFGT
jgi:hypothetical protein